MEKDSHHVPASSLLTFVYFLQSSLSKCSFSTLKFSNISQLQLVRNHCGLGNFRLSFAATQRYLSGEREEEQAGFHMSKIKVCYCCTPAAAVRNQNQRFRES